LLEYDLPPKRAMVEKDVHHYGSDPEFVLSELLHQTAYGKKTLGRSILCPAHQIEAITAGHVIEYMNSLYLPKRMTLVATNFDHGDLTVLAERLFGHLDDSVSAIAPLPSTANETARYYGGEYEISAVLDGPENSQTQSIIAFEGASLKDIKQYYALNVLAQLLGSGNNIYVPTLARRDSLLQQSVIAKNKNIRHARAFSTSYSDSGLFGVYVQGKDGSAVSDAIVATVNLIKNAAEQVTDAQLASAKSATLIQLLSGLETAQGLNEFNAKFDSQDSHIAAIKKLTTDDLKQAAKKLVASKPTLVSVGNLDGILRVSDL
jgi:predicted Zn-dependent peptidase